VILAYANCPNGGRAGQNAWTIGVIRVYVYSSLYGIWVTEGVFYVSAHENKYPRALLGTLGMIACCYPRITSKGECTGCVILGILHFQRVRSTPSDSSMGHRPSFYVCKRQRFHENKREEKKMKMKMKKKKKKDGGGKVLEVVKK
jgi:hypothetical protein